MSGSDRREKSFRSDNRPRPDRSRESDGELKQRLVTIEAKLNKILDLINPPRKTETKPVTLVEAKAADKTARETKRSAKKVVDQPALKAAVAEAIKKIPKKTPAKKAAAKKVAKKAVSKKSVKKISTKKVKKMSQ